MNESPDDALAMPPDEAQAGSPVEELVEGVAAIVGAESSTPDATARSVPAADSRAALQESSDIADTLNLAERFIAELGAWAGMLAERWTPSLGPFFSSDGRTAVDRDQILTDQAPSVTACIS